MPKPRNGHPPYDRHVFTSMVVGTDGSETAGEAVRQAAELAQQIGATVHLVSAYEPVPEGRLREERQQVPGDLQWMVNPREDVSETLEAAAARLREAGAGAAGAVAAAHAPAAPPAAGPGGAGAGAAGGGRRPPGGARGGLLAF